MRYLASWDSLTGHFTVVEYESGTEPKDGEVVLEGTRHELAATADFIKENGFGFIDMWCRTRGEDEFTAHLKAVEVQQN